MRARVGASRRFKTPNLRVWNRFRKTRSVKDRNSLIESYRGFVREVARRLTAKLPRHIEFEDLEVAGIFGLIDAIQHFDPARGVRFETYCEMRVRGAILDELRSQDWLPRQFRSRMARREQAVDSLRAGLGREPTDEEVAERIGIPLPEYRAVYGNLMDSPPPTSSRLEELRGAEGSDAGFEGIEDPRPESAIEEIELRESFFLIHQELTAQEKRIVELRYFQEMGLREIGQLIGLSESRVHKIHAALIERLKRRFSSRFAGSR